MAETDDIPLPNLKGGSGDLDLGFADDGGQRRRERRKVRRRSGARLRRPVNVSAVLGRTRLEIGELLRLGPAPSWSSTARVGEAIDIFVNDRLVARGEVVLVDDRLGVTMTEIIKADR